MKIPASIRCVVLFFSAVVYAHGMEAGTTKTYEAQVAAARRLAGENSWALARDAYAEAMKLAPDDEARRWCELWQAQAEWRAGEKRWRDRQDFEERLKAGLAPYQVDEKNGAGGRAPREKDEFWLEIMMLHLDVYGASSERDKVWDMRREVLDYFASAAPSEQATGRLMAFVRGLDYFRNSYASGEAGPKAKFAEALGLIANAGTLPSEDRAWCALVSFGLSTPEVAMRQRRNVEAVCKGTRHEAVADAMIFATEVQGGNLEVSTDSSIDNQEAWRGGFAGLLARAKQLRARLPEKSDDHVFLSAAESLEDLIGGWESPILMVDLLPSIGTADRVQFSVGTARVRNIKAELYTYDFAAYCALREVEGRNNKLHGADLFEQKRKVPGLRLVDSMPVFTEPVKDEFAWCSAAFRFERQLEPGFYLLLLSGVCGEGKQRVASGDFVVSDVRLVALASAGEELDMYVLGGNDGAPVGGAAVQVASFGYRWMHEQNKGAQIGRTWEGKTDANGRFRMPVADKKGDSDHTAIVANGHPVIAPGMWRQLDRGNYHYGRREKFTADLFLDRHLYRPGETVRWKIIARERKDGGRFALCGAPGILSVGLNGDKIVKNTPVSFNAFGTAHGEFAIPAGARPGWAGWNLELGGGRVHLPDSFGVDNFAPPALKAKIELASPVDEVKPGREIVVRFNVQYYSGGGAADVPVECSAYLEFGEPKGSDASKEAFRRSREWADELSKRTFRGVSNADGNVEFHVSLPAPLPDGAALGFFGKIKPAGMADMRAHGEFHVSEAGVFANPLEESLPRLVGPCSESSFSFDVMDATGRPCAFDGKAVFAERRWLEIWVGPDGREVRGDELASIKKAEAQRRKNRTRSFPYNEYDDSDNYYEIEPYNLMPAGWRKIFADYVVAAVSEQRVVCGGDGRLDARFTPPREGVYEVRLEKNGKALVSQGKYVRWNGRDYGNYGMTDDMIAGRWVFVAADENTKSLALRPGEATVLGLEKTRAGEPVRALLVLPENSSDVFLSLANGDRILTRKLSLQNRVEMIVFDDARDFSGNINAQVFDFRNNNRIVSVAANAPDARAKLALEILPEASERRPGEAGSVKIATRDFSGKPVRAEVAVAVADNALIEMSGRHQMQISEPAFLRPLEAKSVSWWASDQGRNWTLLQRVPDPRPGAAILALKEGRGEDAGLIQLMMPGIMSVDGMLMAPAAGAYEGKSSNLGRIFDIRDLDKEPSREAQADGIRLRRHFAWTAFWEPELVTDRDGRARVSFTYPDNLTQWRIAAYAVGEDGNTFGVAQALTRTSLPLQARVLAPRFLIEGDEVAVSGLLVNRSDENLNVAAAMSGEGTVDLVAAGRELAVSKQAEARVPWQAKAREPGEALFTLTARANNMSGAADAMQISMPVFEDGIRQDTAACARLSGDEASASMTLPLPDPLNRERLDAGVVIAQGRADVMLGALPYLIDYPYGCVEQTMSRFLPAVVVKKTLGDLGLDAGVVEKRILDRKVAGAKERRERPAGLRKLDDVVAKSLGLLREANRHDGGYGWWPGSREADLWMTAYVAWGLQLAGEAGAAVSDDWVKSVRKALVGKAGESNVVDDRLAWTLFVLAEAPASGIETKDFDALRKVYARVYAEREKLSASGRACLLVASARWGTDAERGVLLRNLENGAQRTARGVHWGATGGYRRATEGGVESTALAVMALLRVAPDHALVEPALDWLVMNRRGTGWRNTRASAFAVLALARSVAKERAGADAPGGSVGVFLNGKEVRSVALAKESWLAGATRVALPPELLRSGGNRIELRRDAAAGKGGAVLYATALASAWARGDRVRPGGNFVSVSRGFSGRRIEPTLGGDGKLRATAMAETGVAKAGDEVTARVVLSVPGEMEYLMVAVPKPVGCEPLNPLSSWDAELVRVGAEKEKQPAERRGIYREEHDEHSAFFLDHVEAGEWEIRFAMRAVTAGDFRALPVKVEAMYAPEARANSDARRVRIE